MIVDDDDGCSFVRLNDIEKILFEVRLLKKKKEKKIKLIGKEIGLWDESEC